MSDDITKQEIMAMIEVQSKTAQQMERIANSLHSITEEQKVITSQLTNGIVEKITAAISTRCEQCRKKIDNMCTDLLWVKIIIGSISLVAMIALVIIKLFHL